MKRPRVLSVADAAAELDASEAYVGRLLLRQRLYGTELGFVWAIYPDDLEAFKPMRRPPGRPRKDGRRRGRGIACPHRQREKSRRYRSTTQAAAARAN